MKVIVFVTVLFWGEAPPLEVQFLTSSSTCTPELIKEHSKPLRVLDDWKVMISRCEPSDTNKQ